MSRVVVVVVRLGLGDEVRIRRVDVCSDCVVVVVVFFFCCGPRL